MSYGWHSIERSDLRSYILDAWIDRQDDDVLFLYVNSRVDNCGNVRGDLLSVLPLIQDRFSD